MTKPIAPFDARVIAAARAWIGTPYHHQASVKGIGTDCLGLVRGIYRDVVGEQTADPPPYSVDWAEALARETLLEAAFEHLIPVKGQPIGPAMVLLFRHRATLPAKHIGIASGPDRFIHAVEGRGVVEVALVPGWRRRVAGVFRFPGGDD